MQGISGKVKDFVRCIKLAKNWWIFYLPWKGETILRLRNGMRFVIKNWYDAVVVFEVACEDSYRLGELEAENDASAIVDGGAHIGTFSVRASKEFPYKEILAIEPDKENARLLKENLKLNGCTNVFVIEAAISDKIGTATLYRGEKERSMRRSITEGVFGEKFGEVKTVTLSGFGVIDILKLDIEGGLDKVWPHPARVTLLDMKGEEVKLPENAEFLGKKIWRIIRKKTR